MKLSKLIDMQQMSKAKLHFLDRIGLDRFVDFLYQRKITANHITIFHQILHLASIYFLFIDNTIFGILLLSHILLDNFDGYYAKKTNSVSKMGDLLDHGFDALGSILILIKTIIFGIYFLGILTLIVWGINWLIIVIRKDSHRAFPATWYPLFFIFGLYQIGLIVNIVVGIVYSILIWWRTRKI
jgi:phosphatidylglycerophosphate synthase